MPNDVRFSEAERLLLVTGPNMAGKSTILRQIGLCVVLAQMGAFVPADAAEIGVVDRLFTRVGASDNLARGQSHLHGGDERDQRHPPQRHRRARWSCSTRSAAAPAPTTAWRSPGR